MTQACGWRRGWLGLILIYQFFGKGFFFKFCMRGNGSGKSSNKEAWNLKNWPQNIISQQNGKKLQHPENFESNTCDALVDKAWAFDFDREGKC